MCQHRCPCSFKLSLLQAVILSLEPKAQQRVLRYAPCWHIILTVFSCLSRFCLRESTATARFRFVYREEQRLTTGTRASRIGRMRRTCSRLACHSAQAYKHSAFAPVSVSDHGVAIPKVHVKQPKSQPFSPRLRGRLVLGGAQDFPSLGEAPAGIPDQCASQLVGACRTLNPKP